MAQTDPLAAKSPTSRKKIRSAGLRVVLLILFAALFAWFFVNHREEFSILTSIPIAILAAIAVCQLAVILTNVVFQIILLKTYEVDMSWFDSFVVIVKSSVINFFGFLQGGTGYRAYYLKKNYGVEYKNFALLFAANYLVVFTIGAFFGFFGSLLQLISNNNFANALSTLVFAGITLSLIGMMFLKPTKLPATNRLFRKVREVLSGWESLLGDKRRIFILFLIGFVQFWALAGAFYFELHAIGATTSIAGLMIYSAIAGFSILVALTPAAIGIRETLLIFAKQSLGVGISTIILSATVDRVVYFFLLLLLAVISQEHVVNAIKKLILRQDAYANSRE